MKKNTTSDAYAITLLAAPLAVNYYEHIGFDAHLSSWILRDKSI